MPIVISYVYSRPIFAVILGKLNAFSTPTVCLLGKHVLPHKWPPPVLVQAGSAHPNSGEASAEQKQAEKLQL